MRAREESRTTLEGDRAEARRKRAPDPVNDVDQQLKQARVVGMKAQAEQIAINTIQTKIKLLWENADVYIAIHGQQGYNEMLAGLVNRMARMGDDGAMNTPMSVAFSALQQSAEDQMGVDDED